MINSLLFGSKKTNVQAVHRPTLSSAFADVIQSCTLSLNWAGRARKIALVFTAAAILSTPTLSRAADTCGATAAVMGVVTSIRATGSHLAALDADIDKCFNPSRAQIGAQAHQLLNSLQVQYTQALAQLARAQSEIVSNQAQLFVSDAGQVNANVTAVNKPIFDQASNLKNYGFTTSDSIVNGQYRYPLCNSKTNDNPAEMFASFYNNISALRMAISTLATAATCVQHGG